MTRVYPTQEQYNANPTSYFILSDRTIEKVKNTDIFQEDGEYYQEGYITQNYGVVIPPSTWNTEQDENLESGENYYVITDSTYVISNDPYDPAELYYEDHTDESDRYITLSAKTTQYPLAIGTNVNPSSRKFRVDWDGTCYIEDGEFSGNINAETGTLGELTLTGWLNVIDGAYIDIDRGGYLEIGSSGFISVGSKGYIELKKDSFITMSNGGYLQLSSTGGRIFCDKLSITDFENSGFWLDTQGFHSGDFINYFITTPSYTGFYNVTVLSNGSKVDLYPGVVKISGSGIDLFASQFTSQDWTVNQFVQEAQNGLSKIMSLDEGSIHMGWEPVQDLFYPYLRLGFGTMTLDMLGNTYRHMYMSDAAVIKKYATGIWIGNYGTQEGKAKEPKDDDLIFCGMHFRTGNFFPYNRAKNTLAWTELPTVYRCEVLPIYNDKGVVTGCETVYEPARYARFA